MASSSVVPTLMKDEEPRNWAELPSELMSSIMLRLSAIEILENAQQVCTSWRRASKDPSMWRKIQMHPDGDSESIMYDLEIMCRHAVDRSQGGLVEIDILKFGTDNLLNYIADSASNLRSLRLEMCRQITDKGVAAAVVKLPLLEDLDVTCGYFSGVEFLRVVGQSCPNLKKLKLNKPGVLFLGPLPDDNNTIAIAESMPELRHLQLIGSELTNTGLKAILDGCPHLEHLDLRRCSNINLVGDIERQCSESIKVLRRPNDSTADFPFKITFYRDCYSDSDGIDASDYDDFHGGDSDYGDFVYGSDGDYD